jgi:hypothetical protein
LKYFRFRVTPAIQCDSEPFAQLLKNITSTKPSRKNKIPKLKINNPAEKFVKKMIIHVAYKNAGQKWPKNITH